jgi:hypothetical protein
MSLKMAHKVILPPKKNYIPQFLKQRDINSYYPQRTVLTHIMTGMQGRFSRRALHNVTFYKSCLPADKECIRTVLYRTKRQKRILFWVRGDDASQEQWARRLQECPACSIYKISLEKLFKAGRGHGSTEILTWRSAMFDFTDVGRLYTFTIRQQLGIARKLQLGKLLSGQAERSVSAEGTDHKVHIYT